MGLRELFVHSLDQKSWGIDSSTNGLPGLATSLSPPGQSQAHAAKQCAVGGGLTLPHYVDCEAWSPFGSVCPCSRCLVLYVVYSGTSTPGSQAVPTSSFCSMHVRRGYAWAAYGDIHSTKNGSMW